MGQAFAFVGAQKSSKIEMCVHGMNTMRWLMLSRKRDAFKKCLVVVYDLFDLHLCLISSMAEEIDSRLKSQVFSLGSRVVMSLFKRRHTCDVTVAVPTGTARGTSGRLSASRGFAPAISREAGGRPRPRPRLQPSAGSPPPNP